jgi:hypothetical protein
MKPSPYNHTNQTAPNSTAQFERRVRWLTDNPAAWQGWPNIEAAGAIDSDRYVVDQMKRAGLYSKVTPWWTINVQRLVTEAKRRLAQASRGKPTTAAT